MASGGVVVEIHAHVLFSFHWCVEVVGFDVVSHPLSVGRRYDTVDEHFTVMRSAVGVPQSNGQWILSPPTVILVRLTSSFCGR